MDQKSDGFQRKKGFAFFLQLPSPTPSLWKKVKHAEIPRNAYQAGTFQDKDQFIGKYTSKTDGYSFVGPVIPGKGLISIHGESNFTFRTYDIFLKNDNISWKPIMNTNLPDGALPTVDTIHGKGYIGKHADLGVGMIVCKDNIWTFLSKNTYITSNFDVLCINDFIFT